MSTPLAPWTRPTWARDLELPDVLIRLADERIYKPALEEERRKSAEALSRALGQLASRTPWEVVFDAVQPYLHRTVAWDLLARLKRHDQVEQVLSDFYEHLAIDAATWRAVKAFKVDQFGRPMLEAGPVTEEELGALYAMVFAGSTTP